MLEKIKANFPKSKSQWILFTKTSLPIILASMIFAFNGVIDNFMSVTIEGGLDSLSYSNTWTTLVSGIISTTTIIGSALFGQYYGAKDAKNTTYVIRFRIAFACSIALIFALPAFFNPIGMLNFISGNFITHEIPTNDVVFRSAKLYLQLIAITWISSAWGFTSAMIMREAGHGAASLMSSIISITLNIGLNSIFIFALRLPLYYLAISTIISQFFSVGFNVLFVYFKNKSLIVNPLKMFNISLDILKQVRARIASFLCLAFASITVSIRFIFWNISYPPGSIGLKQYSLAAGTFLGISGALFNVFWSTFESINTNATIFVSKNLGQNKILEAKDNARRLWGFHMVMAIIFCFCLFLVALIIPYCDFLATGYRSLLENKNILDPTQINAAVAYFLEELKYVVFPLAFCMPIWVWFITRSRCISSGGRTNVTSITSSIINAAQTCWIVIIAFVVVPKTNISFAGAYALFFSFDLIKVVVYQTMFIKMNWAKNLTYEIKKQLVN